MALMFAAGLGDRSLLPRLAAAPALPEGWRERAAAAQA
jgi:hypothetical protein